MDIMSSNGFRWGAALDVGFLKEGVQRLAKAKLRRSSQLRERREHKFEVYAGRLEGAQLNTTCIPSRGMHYKVIMRIWRNAHAT